MQRSYVSLDRLLPKCLIFCCYNKCFYFPFLLVYRNTIDFYMLILYSATILNLLTSVNFFGFILFVSSMFSSAHKERSIFYFQIHVSFIYFPGLISLNQASCTMFNGSSISVIILKIKTIF